MKHLAEVETRHRRLTLFRGVESLDFEDRSAVVVACKQMKLKFEAYRLALTENEAITSVVILDPMNKGKNLPERVKANTLRYIKSLLPNPAPVASSDGPSSSKRPRMHKDKWYGSLIRPSEMPESQAYTPEDQLQAYLGEPTTKDGSSVISWWARQGRDLYPALAPIVREFLSISATSAPAERLFSAARAVVNYKRNRLTAESIETLVTVKCWIKGHNTAWYDAVVAEEVEDDD